MKSIGQNLRSDEHKTSQEIDYITVGAVTGFIHLETMYQNLGLTNTRYVRIYAILCIINCVFFCYFKCTTSQKRRIIIIIIIIITLSLRGGRMVKAASRRTYVPVTGVRNPSRSNTSIYVR